MVGGSMAGFVATAGVTTGALDCCDGMGIAGMLVAGIAGFDGSGDGIEPGPGEGTGTLGITGVGGATGSVRPGAAGGIGFADMIRGGSADDAVVRSGKTGVVTVGFVGRLVAGIAGADGLRLKMRLRMPFFSSVGGLVDAAAAGTLGTVAGAGSRLNSRLPRPRFSRGSSGVGAIVGAAEFGAEGTLIFMGGISANEVSGGLVVGATNTGSLFFGAIVGSVDFEIDGTLGIALAGADGGVVTGGSGVGIDGVASGGAGLGGMGIEGVASGGADVCGMGIDGVDSGGATGFVPEVEGATDAGLLDARGTSTGLTAGVLLSGAGSTSVNVSPLFGSFTSVSMLPSGFFVAFTTVTARSGWPWNFSVMVSPVLGNSSAPAPMLSATPAASAHAHRFHIQQAMVLSCQPVPARSSMTPGTSL